MKRARTAAVGLLALGVISCSSVAPVKVSAGDVCYRCRRSIHDERMAGEMISGTFVEKFRAPLCMAKYLVEHPEDTGTTFVTDYATGKMVKPDGAFFVPFVVDDRTGEREYRAFARRAEAEAAALQLKAPVVTWPDVLERARS